MSALIGAVLGTAMGFGVVCIFASSQRFTVHTHPQAWLRNNKQRPLSKHGNEMGASLLIRLAASVLGFVITFVFTGWPVAGGLIAVSAFSAPKLWTAKAQRASELERMAALATWVEMMRDTISAASGLNETLQATADSAPAIIRPTVRQLVGRAERESLNEALTKFAQEMNHAIVDIIALTLSKAAANQVGSLQQALGELANNTRQEVSMRLKIEASRARQHASARFVMGVIAVFCVGLIAFSRPYLEPFDSASGQVALAIIGTLFIGSAVALEKMSRFRALPRILTLRDNISTQANETPLITQGIYR
ncbi:MAG: type II secretion protein F [Acidimicrobiia bacterium]|nr:type II secretion protein F [Acidimicrobiia bacterium]